MPPQSSQPTPPRHPSGATPPLQTQAPTHALAEFLKDLPAPGTRSNAFSGLAGLAESTDESEFYSPLPPGYQRGHHKYVIVLGTVMSGLGKGIFCSSMAKMLKEGGNADWVYGYDAWGVALA